MIFFFLCWFTWGLRRHFAEELNSLQTFVSCHSEKSWLVSDVVVWLRKTTALIYCQKSLIEKSFSVLCACVVKIGILTAVPHFSTPYLLHNFVRSQGLLFCLFGWSTGTIDHSKWVFSVDNLLLLCLLIVIVVFILFAASHFYANTDYILSPQKHERLGDWPVEDYFHRALANPSLKTSQLHYLLTPISLGWLRVASFSR